MGTGDLPGAVAVWHAANIAWGKPPTPQRVARIIEKLQEPDALPYVAAEGDAIALEGRRIEIDATFPGPAWDGRSPLPLACGPGQDYPAGKEPDAEKRALEEQHCDPAVREPFIAALASVSVELGPLRSM